ncbi:dimethylsulfonioproprionate lyase family protein [Dongia deserti]|uniref:dimethylsulfonioproprionate lyase family protein n=1 Tax=Dongia deserti TaxID=2268030 RepID=UPI000E65A3F7|nr:dimethylsulfonioproprionate lyase family protein [Dongia deserti]
MLDAVHADLMRATPAMPAPRTIAASTLLEAALPESAPGGAIAQAAPLFYWRQNPNYSAANMGATFMAGYGYVEFAGPKDALFHAPNIRVGLLVLGPGLHYPLHAHPAEEIYHPLTDGSSWRRGDEDWRIVPALHAIHHPSMIPHETKAPVSTLLSLYCWRGHTTTEARLIA